MAEQANNYPKLHNAAWPGIVGKGTPTTPPSGVPSGTNAAQAQKYLNCVSKASSAADLQACSSLAP